MRISDWSSDVCSSDLMIQEWFGFDLNFTGDKYVLFALGTLIYLYGGMPFLKGMVGEIRAKAIGMMTLVAIAISVAYFYSTAVVFGLQGRSEEHTSELQSLMRISYAVFCLKKKK